LYLRKKKIQKLFTTAQFFGIMDTSNGKTTTEKEEMKTINEVATIENAAAYAAEQDQFIFCLDLLEAGMDDLNIDEIVNKLEDEFDNLNQTTH